MSFLSKFLDGQEIDNLLTRVDTPDISDGTVTRSATIVIAASDSQSKAQADYVCDGTNDHMEIQSAITDLSTNGGKNITS